MLGLLCSLLWQKPLLALQQNPVWIRSKPLDGREYCHGQKDLGIHLSQQSRLKQLPPCTNSVKDPNLCVRDLISQTKAEFLAMLACRFWPVALIQQVQRKGRDDQKLVCEMEMMVQLVQLRQGINNGNRGKFAWNSKELLNTEWISPSEKRGNLKSDSGEKSTDLKTACFVTGPADTLSLAPWNSTIACSEDTRLISSAMRKSLHRNSFPAPYTG